MSNPRRINDPNRLWLTPPWNLFSGMLVQIGAANTGATGRIALNNLMLAGTGLVENKAYIAKVSDTHISVAAGTGRIRKADGSMHIVSWAAIASQAIADIGVGPDENYRLIWQWNVGETALELTTLAGIADALIDNILVLGFLETPGGVLAVDSTFIRISQDPYAGIEGVGIHRRTLNVRSSIRMIPGTAGATPTFGMTAGRFALWPWVASHATERHTRAFAGFADATAMVGHLRYNGNPVPVSDLTIATLSGQMDQGSTTIGTIDTGNFGIHRLGIIAETGVPVWFFTQREYSTLDAALYDLQTERISYASWVEEAWSVIPVAKIILQQGATEISQASLVTYAGPPITYGYEGDCMVLPWASMEWERVLDGDY